MLPPPFPTRPPDRTLSRVEHASARRRSFPEFLKGNRNRVLDERAVRAAPSAVVYARRRCGRPCLLGGILPTVEGLRETEEIFEHHALGEWDQLVIRAEVGVRRTMRG